MKNLFFILFCSLVLHSANAQESFAKKVKGKYMYGLKDESGKQLTPPKYDYISDFKCGLAEVEANDKKGFIDRKGNEVVTPKYDQIMDFDKDMGVASMKENDKWGLIDSFGKVLIAPKYLHQLSFDYLTQHFEVIMNDNSVWGNYLYGAVDDSYKEVIPPKYRSVDFLDDGYIKVSVNGSNGKVYGLLDENYKEVVSPGYKKVFAISENLFAVVKTDKWSLLNGKGNAIGNMEYETVWSLSIDRAKVKRNGKLGFIDENGKEIISCKFDEAEYFKADENKVKVKLNGREYFIDKNGTEIK